MTTTKKTTKKEQAAAKIAAAVKRVNSPYYTAENFISDAKRWISAIESGRMLCRVHSVSKSGMSRVFSYHSFELYSKPMPAGRRGYYRQYYSFLQAMGHTMTDSGIRVSGCGMDMNFSTCYNIAHHLESMGIISRRRCEKLAQNTPAIL